MKHVELFENFLFEGEFSSDINTQKIADIIKKSPKASQSVEYCRVLVDSMIGFGTDEAKLFSIFSKIKTKGEMVQLMAIWDMMGLNYDSDKQTNLALMGTVVKLIGGKLTGSDDAYARQVSNRINLLGRRVQRRMMNLDFWNRGGNTAANSYMKVRAEWYKKNPSQQKTSLFYWLREELDTEELAKLNGIIKKFGMKI